jgi:hypothetical protein
MLIHFDNIVKIKTVMSSNAFLEIKLVKKRYKPDVHLDTSDESEDIIAHQMEMANGFKHRKAKRLKTIQNESIYKI